MEESIYDREDYDKFYHHVWGNLISVADVSDNFRVKNENFIDEVTFISFKESLRSNIGDEAISRLIKGMLSSLESFNLLKDNIYS